MLRSILGAVAGYIVTFAGEVIYKFTPQFQIGFEARRFQTQYLFSRRQRANHINLAMAYTF